MLRAVRPEVLAADAVDEAFARAFAGWDRVQAMRSPEGWVYRVAVNEARRQLRRATRADALLVALPEPAPSPPPGGEAWLLVEDLPLRQRAAVVLRHVAGLTEREIGDALGVTRSTVSSSLADAYRSLGRQLGTDLSTPSSARAPRPLALAVVRTCRADGCDVEPLDGEPAHPATYSDAVRDTIKVRPGDLVAVEPDGPTVVWRWWSGTVRSLGDRGGDGTGTIVVARNVTQRAPDDPRQADIEVDLPDDLRGGVDVGETVWFGSEEGRKVVVAVAGPEAAARAAAKFPAIRQAIG